MRVVFVGAGDVTQRSAESLVKGGHEVIIIEERKERIEAISEQIDCSFLQGDGSQPGILKEVNPQETDFLFCLTNSDQDNLIAALVGRSLGFSRVVTRIENPEFESICLELGLKDTILPSRTISRYLVDMVEGENIIELSTLLKYEARFFAFTVGEDGPWIQEEMSLPDDARIVCFTAMRSSSFPPGPPGSRKGMKSSSSPTGRGSPS